MIPVGTTLRTIAPEYGGVFQGAGLMGLSDGTFDFPYYTGGPVAAPAPSTSIWANLANLLGAGAGATTQIIRATRDPYIIPGSGQVIYDPATGRVTTPAGAVAQGVGMGLVPIAAIAAVGLVVLLVAMKGK